MINILIAIFWGFLLWGIIRKLAARMQNRIGPPIIQPLFDFFKLVQKESIIPRNANKLFIDFGLLLSFVSILSILFFIPGIGFLNFKYDIIVVIYLLIACVVGFALIGFGSNSSYSSLGTIREIVLLFSLEPALIISLITVGLLTSFSVSGNLFILNLPFAFFAFLIAMLAELKLPPFHIPEAEQELVSGLLTEITGKRLGIFQLIYSLRIIVFTSLAAVLFLGGGNILMLLLKTLILVFILTLFRVVFARLRIDQGLKVLWFVIPIACIDLVRVLMGFV